VEREAQKERAPLMQRKDIQLEAAVWNEGPHFDMRPQTKSLHLPKTAH
jgi:hypothetical protein